jgi:Nitrogen regulatory protein PII
MERKITKIEIITRPEKLEELKEAMNAIRVTGMTVSQVYGCGLSKGYTEIYRGTKVSINLLPKIKVEIVVCEIPVETVVEAAKKACQTGEVGDGKVFVYQIDNAVRIRTGEEGPAAIMDRPEDVPIVNETVAKAKK